MKEIREAIHFYKSRIQSTYIVCPFFMLFMGGIAIFIFVKLPEVWWIGTTILVIVAITLICFIYYIKKYTKKIKKLEKELKEIEQSMIDSK